MKISTAAIGNYYVKRLGDLSGSLPKQLDCVLLEGDYDLGYRGFNYSACKRTAMKLADSDVLFINVDMICHDPTQFTNALKNMEKLPSGIYSIYTFSSYGIETPTVQPPIDKSRLNWKFKFLADIFNLKEDDMLMKFPLEIVMLMKFDNTEQRNKFFDMWYEAEQHIVNDKRFTLIEECYSIGIAAYKYGLPVKNFPCKLGLTHSHRLPDGTLRIDTI